MMSFTRIWHPDINNVQARTSDPAFARALLQRVDKNNSIVLAMADAAFVDLAINFYMTSLKLHGIENYLFVGVSHEACRQLHRFDSEIACHTYTDDVDSDTESDFNSQAFVRKTNLRTEMILDALLVGVTVVHTDVDVVFLKNPLPEMLGTDTDITVLWDSSSYNAGFLAIKPTKPSIWIYDRIKKLTDEGTSRNDQFALDDCLDRCSIWGVCSIYMLDPKKYLNGQAYFEEGSRTFATDNPCSDCVVVHDNFIVTQAAKIYRLKETHMWLFDKDGYYSSKTNKYIHLHSPVYEKLTIEQQHMALRNALAIGRILNRSVILPQFHCVNGAGSCALNSFYKIATFDQYFLNDYRESTFLTHPDVPVEVRHSLSYTHYITKPDFDLNNKRTGVLIKHLMYKEHAVTSNDILEWFHTDNHSVLSLGHLHELDITFIDKTQNEEWKALLQTAFQHCEYRQFCDR